MDAIGLAQVDALVRAANAPAQTALDVGVAILGRTLDSATTQNTALLQMMRDSLSPNIGGNLDLFG